MVLALSVTVIRRIAVDCDRRRRGGTVLIGGFRTFSLGDFLPIGIKDLNLRNLDTGAAPRRHDACGQHAYVACDESAGGPALVGRFSNAVANRYDLLLPERD